jgi:hypothetical protein
MEQALSDRPGASPPAEVDAHLRDCADCARRAATLESIPALIAAGAEAAGTDHGRPLYDGALRARTLAAAARQTSALERRLAWLVAPAGALVVLISFALPAWLLSIPLSNLLDSRVLALGLALLAVHATGVIPAGLCTILALRHRATAHRLEEVFHE